MLIDIDKVVVGDRIRKDFSGIDELAGDISRNGLINPIVVTENYVLIAGERRLRACKSLGWTQIEAHVIDAVNDARDTSIEISENTMRRNFTGSELAEGIRRLMAIESEKAKERMLQGRGNLVTSPGKTRDKVGMQFGISGRQAEKVVYVDDHRDLLGTAAFKDWNECKLSTNKAYQKIKEAQRLAEEKTADDQDMMIASSRLKPTENWTTTSVRRLLANPPGTKQEPCDICGKHECITELHHVVQLSEVANMLNAHLVKASELEVPVAWLCPNCHAYAHALMRGEIIPDKDLCDGWTERFSKLEVARINWLSACIEKEGLGSAD